MSFRGQVEVAGCADCVVGGELSIGRLVPAGSAAGKGVAMQANSEQMNKTNVIARRECEFMFNSPYLVQMTGLLCTQVDLHDLVFGHRPSMNGLRDCSQYRARGEEAYSGRCRLMCHISCHAQNHRRLLTAIRTQAPGSHWFPEASSHKLKRKSVCISERVSIF